MKSFDVFDFKPEEELSALTASKFTSKFRDSSAMDKYMFLENVAQGTKIQSEEFSNMPEVDVNADNSGCNGDRVASVTFVDTGDDTEEHCVIKRMSGLNGILQINSVTPDQPPQFRPNKLEPRISMEVEASNPTATSPFNSKLNFALLESQRDDESYETASDADGSMGEKSPSTSSDMEADDAPLGPLSETCFDGWEMAGRDMEIVFSPDYAACRDQYCTDALVKFSSSCIEIKGSSSHGDKETFVFQWATDDIIDIKSQWFGRYDMAMVEVRVSSKDEARAGHVFDTSGIEELKFAVIDSHWFEKLEALTSLDVYKALWSDVLDLEAERYGEALLGDNGVFFPKQYFPNFEKPFEDVIYPKGDADAVSISKRDIDLLEPDTFVNDTIIDFYIKYLKNKIQPDERHRYHFFNSFFFRKLADLDKDPSSAFDARAAFLRVRKWTRKVNLFEKDYIFIPVNFNYHWSLLVICHPGEAATFKDEDIERSHKIPCILHMDSFKGTHSGLKDLLQRYLWEEWKERQKETVEDTSSRFVNLRFLSLELPQQQNSFDCGLFLLHYAELFLEKAPLNFNPFKITKFSNFLNVDWFQPAEASLKRALIQRLIYDLLYNPSPEIPPNTGNQGLHTFGSHKPDCDNNIAVEFLCERPIGSMAADGNEIMTQVGGQGIEVTLLPSSSMNSTPCPSDPGFLFREFFVAEAAVEPLSDQQHQAFNQTRRFEDFKSAITPIEEEEDGEHVINSQSTENGLEQFTTEVCGLPYSSSSKQPFWDPTIQQTGHELENSSPEASISDSDDSIVEIDVRENISPSTKKECFSSAATKMLNADSGFPVEIDNRNDDIACLQVRGSDSFEDFGSGSDSERAPKKLCLTPPSEGEGGLARTLSNDLHL